MGNIKRVTITKAALLVCDIQQKFGPSIFSFDAIVEVTKRLIQVANILEMKIVATEQYPKGLGHTVEELKSQMANIPIFEKKVFSMCIPEVENALPSDNEAIILCGIEAHACILQTALDFLSKGKDVYVIVDAVSSRSNIDRKYAYKKMENAGAVLTTCEAMIFELTRSADHPNFREIQKLIMSISPDSGLSHI
uniref:Isochorismatase domain-containing protein n=1 Tax=Rhabditophanes sp. KR3021 TaxID=114890 RepID=A0AC35U8A5_9BILA